MLMVGWRLEKCTGRGACLATDIVGKERRAENGIGCGLNRDTHHIKHHKGPQLEMGKVGEMAKVLIRLGARRPSS